MIIKVTPQRTKSGVALRLKLSDCWHLLAASPVWEVSYVLPRLWELLWYYPRVYREVGHKLVSSMVMGQQQDWSLQGNRHINWYILRMLNMPTTQRWPTHCWLPSTQLLTIRVGCSPVDFIVFDNIFISDIDS